ncbi:MAG: phytanoyl-CoA dioxygenase family protein [Stenomitos rutilans HA7619-LM2]|jgi:hypothetical protein|nr:phytanoyl-CoA dioxygenase family protein [Stenomitos rutilans HA7619-LM2]
MTHVPVQLSDEQIHQFREDGFLILEKFLDLAVVDRIDARLDPLFATQFETGVYPDEWHGRPGLSQPTATRQMCGMWRCDRTVASLSLSAEVARLNATLAGWSGARLATDSCWIKPPGAPEVSFHRNNTAFACINPTSVVTCWIALSDGTPSAAPLEVVPGSHQWRCSDQFRFLHAPKEDYRQLLWTAAEEAGIDQPESLAIAIPAGSCVFLDGNLWHGSGRNITPDQTRRSFAITTLPAEAQFDPAGTGPGYIFSRYRRIGQTEMDESFFPILWTQAGDRTSMLAEYCNDALVNA